MGTEILISVIKLVFGLAILVKGADLLITGASGLARRAGIPEFVIGLTLVAFGTSLPELTVNVQASLQKASEITLGNVIGSNIANILLILGIAGIIRPLSIHKTFVKKEIPLNFLSILVLFAMVSDKLLDGSSQSLVSRSEGLVLVTTFMGYLYFLAAFLERDEVEEQEVQIGYAKGTAFIVLGLAGLIFGANWTVSGGVNLALALGVSQAIIGLFLIAVGTSLPELLTSAVAAYRGNSDIAIGNVAGSNIFNVSLVLGASALVNPIPVPERVFKDLVVLFIATFLLLVSNYTGRRYTISRWEGGLFLLIYTVYALYSWYVEITQ
ncbi:cation:H+ antiporter [Hydrogenivirga caldilitoris]|uniref:Cation:H+ antiporter n=1 Tax=Hydrogenivirga caldilitoris TaxID=246264 RepID=A0A497XSY6_9AQUI|nr:calcium/sodium antiporter [Hydrogenivirga caldilitoris]RLJ71414.1 cation:H+ antiporter [Hydrogenivirga caldilitoris]